ncbi:MAG: hypothetical protein ACT4PJ_03830 [Gemmatimonadaceae bacterium]
MRATILVCTALLALARAASLRAQADAARLVGARVRVAFTAPGSPHGFHVVVGDLVAVTDSTLSIRPPGSTMHETISTSSVQGFEVRTGRDRGRGAGFGALIGLGSGLIIGYALGDDCGPDEFICFDRDETMLGGGFVGAAIGGLIGLAVGRGDRWAVRSVPGRVSVVPLSGGGVRLGASLRF